MYFFLSLHQVDATQTTYTVELLARVKKIVIDKTKCKICGDKEGSTAAESHLPRSEIGYGVTPIGGDTPYGGGATPFNAYGSETPLHPSVNDSDGPNPFNASERDREEALTSEEFGTLKMLTIYLPPCLTLKIFIYYYRDGSIQRAAVPGPFAELNRKLGSKPGTSRLPAFAFSSLVQC